MFRASGFLWRVWHHSPDATLVLTQNTKVWHGVGLLPCMLSHTRRQHRSHSGALFFHPPTHPPQIKEEKEMSGDEDTQKQEGHSYGSMTALVMQVNVVWSRRANHSAFVSNVQHQTATELKQQAQENWLSTLLESCGRVIKQQSGFTNW